MDMDKEEIKNIIKNNPEFSYDRIKQQAIQANVTPKIFDEAWNELNANRNSITKKNRLNSIYLSLFAIGLIGIEIMIWGELSNNKIPLVIEIICPFLVNSFILYFIAKFLSSKSTPPRAVWIAISFIVMKIIIDNGGMMTSVMLITFITLAVYMLVKTYNMNVLESVITLILQSIIIFIFVFVSYFIINIFV